MMKIKPTTLRRWLHLAPGIWFLLAGTALAQEDQTPPPDEESGAAEDKEGENAESEASSVEAEAEPEAEAGADAEDEGVSTTESSQTASEGAPEVVEQTEHFEGREIETEASANTGLSGESVVDPTSSTTSAAKPHLSFRIATREIPVVTRAYYELHFNVVSDDYSGNDWLSLYLLMVSAQLTEHDQVAIRADLEQKFIADPEENGLWFGDLRFYYNRSFTIPIPNFEIPAIAQGLILVPTSRQSQERSYVLKPRATFVLMPSIGPLKIRFDYLLQYQFAKYAESGERSNPNVQLMTGYYLYLYASPVKWFTPMFTWFNYWAVPYRDREGNANPTRPYYGFDISANFSLPMPKKAPAIDVSLAYTQGANMLEGGIYRTYFAKRDQSDIYLSIDIRY